MISTRPTVLSGPVNDPSNSAPPGWFPDPVGRHEHRYFNGVSWTSDVSDGGQRFVDPIGSSGGPAQATGRNGAAVVAMTLGILGAFVAWIPVFFVIGTVMGVLALVFGVKGRRRAAIAGTGRAFATTGIITGVLALLLSIVGVILSAMLYREVSAFIDPGDTITAVVSCQIDGRDVAVDGTLTNDSGATKDYHLFVDVAGATGIVDLVQIDPGTTVRWSTTMRTRVIASACTPELHVQGPYPWGIQLDPISP